MKTIFLALISLILFGSGLAYAGDYALSAHGNSSSGVSGRLSGYGTGNCAHCHEQHASIDGVSTGPNPALIFSAEEATCTTCHNGTIVSPNMDFSGETYKHPTFVASNHTLSMLEYGLDGAPFRTTVTTPITRHAECADCHEPHTVQSGTHQLFDTGNTDGADNNLVSGVLKGVWGVEPTSSPLWSPPTGFTELTTIAVGSTKEYQICYKCHSYYALQDADGVTAVTGPSGGLITDQAMEFSPGNRSVHPVQVGLTSQTGSVAPKPLTAAQMKSSWNVADNMGVQTMYCSDCHGNDAATHAGPHGSDNKFLLVGYAGASQNDLHWFERTSTELWQLSDVNDTSKNDIFCVNCHVLRVATESPDWKNEVHDRSNHSNFECVDCHVGLPHGSNFGRLIADRDKLAPYDYGDVGLGGQARITAYTKRAPWGYDNNDCTAVSCSGNH